VSESAAPRSWNWCRDASEAPRAESDWRNLEATVKYVILLLDTEAAKNMT